MKYDNYDYTVYEKVYQINPQHYSQLRHLKSRDMEKYNFNAKFV